MCIHYTLLAVQGSGNFNAPLAVYHAAAYQQEIEVDDDKPTELQALKALDDPAPKETAKWPIADLRIVQPYVYLAVPRKYTENSAVYVIEPKHFNSSKDWDPEMMERNRIMLRRWASNQRILTLREMGDDDQFKNLYMGLLEEERAQIPEQIVEQYIDDYASGEETDGIDEGEYTPFYPREIEALEKAMAQELDTTGDIKMEIKTTESDEEVPNKESMDKDDRLKDRSVYLHEQDTGLADFDDKRYRLLHIWDVDDQLRREHTTRVYLPDSEAEQEAEEEEAERQEYLRGEKWVRRRNRRIDAGLDPSSSSDGLTSEESASESEEELEYMNPERPEMMPQPQYMPVGIEYLGVEQNMVE
ncbi:hypothetical protein SARC_06741 [Sphaeroforma arctica JP610]|uniref:Uncharacterized protein n=1 Tax=Sphaeroforma arctica JP610 TaxID=667725 RepID=A0A0L0FVP2_9EUKA|nr:hypothetical protein SARC_06741 [Sphaeroforma arctica JP610]KNC80920.1 hypothetical protein SARC_06741 [Sphaeroforma arctica JP610]|eukprot:XP_014154822.1 hypothetical protein SARC_06741 [Sphaeroforma arctica JP610]